MTLQSIPRLPSPPTSGVLDRLQTTASWTPQDWLSITEQFAALGIPHDRMTDLLMWILSFEVN